MKNLFYLKVLFKSDSFCNSLLIKINLLNFINEININGFGFEFSLLQQMLNPKIANKKLKNNNNNNNNK